MMVKGVRAGTHSEGWGREHQIIGAATLKLKAPNEVWINRTESRLVCNEGLLVTFFSVWSLVRTMPGDMLTDSHMQNYIDLQDQRLTWQNICFDL